jgi:NTP pyrophosphatase (non-canonical NTP hydrolase)
MHVAEIPVPSADFEKNIISAIEIEDKDLSRFKKRRMFVTLSGIAAAMLILAGSYFFFTGRSGPQDTYSDPELAYAETMKILYEVSSRLNNGTKALGHLSALQDETQKTMATVSSSTAKIEENMKPLDKVFNAIGKSGSNDENINK